MLAWRARAPNLAMPNRLERRRTSSELRERGFYLLGYAPTAVRVRRLLPPDPPRGVNCARPPRRPIPCVAMISLLPWRHHDMRAKPRDIAVPGHTSDTHAISEIVTNLQPR